MKTFAPEKTKDTRVREGSTNSRISELTWPVLDLSGYSAAPIFRKTSCPCGGGCPACQAKSSDLKVSQPNDPAEIEADQIADRVMRMPVDAPVKVSDHQHEPNKLHAKGDAGEEEEETQTILRKEGFAAAADPPPGYGMSSVKSVINSGGIALDHESRSFFEPRFGVDLGHVRIHTNSTAGQSATAINAKAYTLGNNIVFSNGEYKPDSESGEHLLAHELAHVVQSLTHSPKINRSVIYRQPTGDQHGAAKQEPPEFAAVRQQLANIEAAWSRVKSVAKGSTLAVGWVKRGDEVMVLIRAHTDGAIEAMKQNDSSLAKQYNNVIETDLIAYQYVSWYAFFCQNLDRIYPWVNNLSDTFKRDNRDFTGRKKAEEVVSVLKQLGEKEQKNSPGRLSQVMTTGFKLKSGSGSEVTVTLTSAADKKKRQDMQNEIVEVQKLEAATEVGVSYVNQFLDTAFQEGLEQAGEAVVEFYLTKQSLKKPKTDQEKQTSPTPNIGPMPFPMPEEGQKRRKKCKDICDTPLPVKWPRIMPLPGGQRPLVRTPSGDDYIEPDKRSKPQRDLQKEIEKQRDRHRSGKPGAYVPRPCFANDADPNAPYDAHHIHPLYLGGAEDEINLCALRTDYHQRAHPALNNQKMMLNTNAVWISCKVCSGHLPDHLALQEYYIDGKK